MEDTVVRKTDSRLIKRSDGVVCLPGARKEHVTHRERERVEQIMGRGNGGSILHWYTSGRTTQTRKEQHR